MNSDRLARLRRHLPPGTGQAAFDAFLLAGLPLIAIIRILGRSLLTETLAAMYIAGLVGYVLARGVGLLAR